jgi:Zn-dependent oligopeptidase
MPVMQFADNRELRKQIYLASATRGTRGQYDNRENILKFKALRQEKAELLGYANFAEYQLHDRMAGNVATVDKFLEKLADAYREPAKRELAELEALAGHKVEPWDVKYYQEQLRRKKFGLDESKLKPYFAFDHVLKGAMEAAHRLYGVTFAPADIPVWHPTVKAFEVFNRAGERLGYYYIDPFPRPGKRPGAWMTDILPGGYHNGVMERPHVVNVANLTPPVKEGEPALLTLNDVRTVFHEMGHGLHSLLSQARYRSLFGTSVTWDFVELPSLLNEYWMLEPEVLDVYARHYKTGERLSDDVIQKIKDSAKVSVAMEGLRQVYLSQLDMAWYTQPLGGRSVDQFEADVRRKYEVISNNDVLISTAFLHIFPNSYAAGYYSYRWADVLASDAHAQFEKHAIIDPKTGKQTLFNPAFTWRYQLNVLEAGATVDPDVAYARFKGGPPDPDALLKSQGILPSDPDKKPTRRQFLRRLIAR